MREGTKDELVETGADLTILPHRERVLLICMAEASKQFCRTKAPHSSSLFYCPHSKKIRKWIYDVGLYETKFGDNVRQFFNGFKM